MRATNNYAPTGCTDGARGITREPATTFSHTNGNSQTYRCRACGDPCHAGWSHCLKCHAYDDLAESLRFREIGLDQFLMQRARSFFHGQRHAESLESLLRKLTRRVVALEYEEDLR